MSESVSFDIKAVQLSPTSYKYTIALTDTGTTPIGTFWYSWVPGAGYLPNPPTFSAPTGWQARQTDGPPPSDGYSIQYVADSAATALQPGKSFDGFTFTSATAPSVMFGPSTIHPPTPVDTATVYSGSPFSDAGFITSAGVGDAFLSNGQIDEYVGGALTLQRTPDTGGGFDVRRFGLEGTFDGVAYTSVDNAFNAADQRISETFYNSANEVVASETFNSDGGFGITVGGVLVKQKDVNPDATFEIWNFTPNGATYTSNQTDFSAKGVLLANSFDNVDGAGRVDLFGADLNVRTASEAVDLGATADFQYVAHANEFYAFFTGATRDAVIFASGFGHDTVQGFSGASAKDVLNVSALFSNFADARAAMTTAGSNTIITDAARDTLTLIGIAKGTLTAAELGFSTT